METAYILIIDTGIEKARYISLVDLDQATHERSMQKIAEIEDKILRKGSISYETVEHGREKISKMNKILTEASRQGSLNIEELDEYLDYSTRHNFLDLIS
ncbi:MAG: hypothetical protein V1870_04360 [Candidatus Aenigmatarchaeota archaeon]